MKTPKSVTKAMKMMGMKKGDDVEKVVAANKTALTKENEAINKHNKQVYENKKKELMKVANVVKKYENMRTKDKKVKVAANEKNTKVKKMARNYNTKIAAKA